MSYKRLALVVVLLLASASAGTAQQVVGNRLLPERAAIPAQLSRSFGSAETGRPVGSQQGRARQPWRYFSSDATFLSPRVWVAGVDGASAAFGASIERRLSDDDPDADGAWGIGGDFDYYSAKLGDLSGSVLIVGAIANYHFLPSNGHLDPFIGAGLAYAKAEIAGIGVSGLLWQTQAGLRYAITDATAIGAHAGTGIGNVAISLTLKF